MKTRKRIVRESNEEIVYQEIERMYGVKTAKALERYCAMKNLDPDTVVNDTSTDRNGMCEWDKFDVWAKKQGVDFTDSFGDVDVDDLLGVGKKRKSGRQRATRIYDRPVDSDIYGESGSRMDEYDIINWIYDEMKECEWADDLEFSDDEPSFEVSMPDSDGDVFRVSVQKIWSGRLGERLD